MANELKHVNKNLKTLIENINSNFRKFGDQVSDQVGSVMTEEINEITSTVKGFGATAIDSSRNMFKFFTGSALFQTKILSEHRRQVKFAKEQLAINKREERRKLSTIKRMPKGIFDFLFLPLTLLGAALGAAAGLVIKPLQLFTNLFTKILPVGKLLRMIPGVGKAIDFFTKFMGFLNKIPGIGHFLRGIRFGFSKLFLPLQIILSSIDFVKGFMNTQGDVLEKIKGGLKNVWLKFWELPAMLMGKLVDWVGKSLGFEMATNEGQKILDFFNKSFDVMWSGARLVITTATKIFSTIFEKFKNTINSLIENFSKIPETIFNFIKKMPFGEDILKRFGFKVPEKVKLPEMKPAPETAATITDHEQRRLEAMKKRDNHQEEQAQLLKSIDKSLQNIAGTNKELVDKDNGQVPVFVPTPVPDGQLIPANPEVTPNNNSF